MEMRVFSTALLLTLEEMGCTQIESCRAFERGIYAALAEAERKRLFVFGHRHTKSDPSRVVSAFIRNGTLRWHPEDRFWTFGHNTPRECLIALCHVVRDPVVRFSVKSTAVAFLNAVYADSGLCAV